MNPYDILGVERLAPLSVAKAAYRRLAQKHHPDHGGDEEKFKSIKAAFELLESGWAEPVAQPPRRAPTSTRWTKPEPVWDGYAAEYENQKPKKPFNPYAGHRPFGATPRYTPKIVEAFQAPAPRKNLGEYICHVSMAEAYRGFICEITVDGKKIRIPVPKGVPHGLRHTVSIEGREEDVTICTRFTQNLYGFIGIDQAIREGTIVNSAPAVVHRTNELTLAYEIDQRDLNRGCTITLSDFLGESFSVRVPAGYDTRIPMRVPGKGYVDWYSSHSQAGDVRGDLLIRFIRTENVPMSNIR